MEDIAGFVNGNNMRRNVLDVLNSKGPMDAKRIAKTLRCIPVTMDKVISEMEDNKLIANAGGKYDLTSEGKAVINFIHSV
ncbi:transcriptional regulator [Methanolapillus millepedarum]|uniref:HVO-A0261-like N-terminal domain-containing protein n=1 Tax=Methanolapillus millepedarum TaxID=3028296 RepID=A0AA96ZTV0_9EURY|nr:hypothetical protein MsAc7_05420 [Methanosarcinaceae archaeon Ac7]